MPSEAPATGPVLGILLIDGSYERAHYAFVVATGAAAIGRPVVLFATNAGCGALTDAADDEHERRYRQRGVAGLAELRAAARQLGVRLIACEAGLRVSGLPAERLLPGVEVAGVVTFLAATAGGQLLSL